MRFAQMIMLCAVLSASVADAADSGFYFGAIGGKADYDFEPPRFLAVIGGGAPTLRPLPEIPPVFGPYPGPIGGVTSIAVASPITWPESADHEATAWGAFAGYRIFRYMAVEAAYLNLGTLERTQRINLFPSGAFIDTRHTLETSGPAGSVLGILPLGERWALFARAGVLFADMELDSKPIGGSVPVIDGSDSITFGSDSLLWGAGAQFNWGEHWSVRLDFQRFENVGEDSGAGEADIDLLSLGVLFRL